MRTLLLRISRNYRRNTTNMLKKNCYETFTDVQLLQGINNQFHIFHSFFSLFLWRMKHQDNELQNQVHCSINIFSHIFFNKLTSNHHYVYKKQIFILYNTLTFLKLPYTWNISCRRYNSRVYLHICISSKLLLENICSICSNKMHNFKIYVLLMK